MSFKQQWTSFWEKKQEAFYLHLEARRSSSFVEEFIASDPVNGPIVKATERKILYGSLGIPAGAGLSILAKFLLHKRQKPLTSGLWWDKHGDNVHLVVGYKLVLLSIGGISPFAAHFGVSSFLLLDDDRRDAYAKFNKWLQNRA